MSSSRRKFIQYSAGIAAGGLLSACTLESENKNVAAGQICSTDTVHWKIVTTWPPHFPVIGEGVEKFAKWVEELTCGKFIIKVYGAGELVPAAEVMDAVSNGAVEMGHSCPYYWAGKLAASQIFASFPFGMNAQQMNAWFVSGGGQELWEEVYSHFGVLPMLAGNTGVQMGGWYNREINSIDDFKGLKIRMPGLGGKVVNKAGASVLSVAGGEIYTNLERGVIDATEWIGPYHDFNMGFHRIAKYYYYPGWHEPGTPLEIIINKEAFAKLPHNYQAALRFAAARLNTWIFAESDVKNAIYLEKLVKEEKVLLRRFPDEVLKQLKVYAFETYQELCQKDALFKKVFDAYMEFRATASRWSEVTEKSFYSSIQ